MQCGIRRDVQRYGVDCQQRQQCEPLHFRRHLSGERPRTQIVVFHNDRRVVSGDDTPNITDATDFSTTPIDAPITHTFTIVNTGSADLTLGAITVPAGFTLIRVPSSQVGAGDSTTFAVQCDAQSAATFSGTVTILNSDSAQNPYTFAITCQVNPVRRKSTCRATVAASLAGGRIQMLLSTPITRLARTQIIPTTPSTRLARTQITPDNSVNPPGTNPDNPVNPSDTNPNAPGNVGNPGASDGTHYPTTMIGTPVIQTFTILNLGTGDLTLGAITVRQPDLD